MYCYFSVCLPFSSKSLKYLRDDEKSLSTFHRLSFFLPQVIHEHCTNRYKYNKNMLIKNSITAFNKQVHIVKRVLTQIHVKYNVGMPIYC